MTNKVTIKSTKEPVRLRVKNIWTVMWTESAAMSF